MNDLFYVAITLAFFAVSIAYVKGCDKLLGKSDHE